MHQFLKYLRTADEQSRIVFSALVILLSFLFTSLLTEGLAWLAFGREVADRANMVNHPKIFVLIQVCQSIGLYLIPGFFLSRVYSGSAWRWIRLHCSPPWRIAVVYLAGLALVMPCIPFLTEVNSRIIEYLPHETILWLKALEEPSNRMVETLLHGNRPGQFVGNILLLALVPALGEEMLFRGIIQRHLCQWWKKTLPAIVVTAFLFSAIHLQFYGFLPRLVLGLLLGYAMEHSKSLWLPIALHLVNNTLVVALAYFRL